MCIRDRYMHINGTVQQFVDSIHIDFSFVLIVFVFSIICFKSIPQKLHIAGASGRTREIHLQRRFHQGSLVGNIGRNHTNPARPAHLTLALDLSLIHI